MVIISRCEEVIERKKPLAKPMKKIDAEEKYLIIKKSKLKYHM